MPKLTSSDLQKLLDAPDMDALKQTLTDLDVDFDSGEGGEETASTPEDSPPSAPPFGEKKEKSPFGESNPFENRKDVAKRAMKKTGFPDKDED